MTASRLILTVILALGLLVVPLAAGAQPAGKVYRIGLLYASSGFDPNADPMERALVINLKTAKALGRTIPPSVLARASEVME